MTRPTLVFFGPDGGRDDVAKIYLRTLFYSTSKRGHVIENAYVRLRRGESQQNFNIWVYGDKELMRGSGLFVGPEGIATNHHFLTPTDIKGFEFRDGRYELDVLVKIVGRTKPIHLTTIELRISEGDAIKLRDPRRGIFFDWGPDSATYHAHVDVQPDKPDYLKLLQALSGSEQKGADSQKVTGVNS